MNLHRCKPYQVDFASETWQITIQNLLSPDGLVCKRGKKICTCCDSAWKCS